MKELIARAENKCELCESEIDLVAFDVTPRPTQSVDSQILTCGKCSEQLADGAELDDKHWYCLQTAMWSEVPAVKVVAWRLLNRFPGEVWAQDLLEQGYFEEDVLAWAKAGQPEEDDRPPAFDSNGKQLQDGDSVTLIKDLDVKGTSFVAKRGTLVKGIRLTHNPEHVEGRVNKVAIVLVTRFLKKA